MKWSTGLALLLACTSTPYKVSHAGESNSERLVYALPATDFMLSAASRQKQTLYPELYCYAHAFGLRAEQPEACRTALVTDRGRPPNKDSVAVRSVGIDPVAYPDMARLYAVDFSDSSARVRRNIELMLTADARLSGGGVTARPQTGRIISQSLTSVASLAGSVVSSAFGVPPTPNALADVIDTGANPATDEATSFATEACADAAAQAVDAAGTEEAETVQDALEAARTTFRAAVRKAEAASRAALREAVRVAEAAEAAEAAAVEAVPPAARDAVAAATTCEARIRARYLYAARIAAELATARTRRAQLISNLPPQPGEGVTRAIAALDADIARLQGLFAESHIRTDHQATLRFGPENEVCVEVATNGRLSRLATCPAPLAANQLSIKATREGAPVGDSDAENALPCGEDCGIVYRVPGQAIVEVSSAEEHVFLNRRITVAQWGGVASLPNEFVGETTMRFALSPETGMLMSLAFEESDVDLSALESVSGAASALATSVRSTRAERSAAEPSANSELEDTVRRLELERQIACYTDTGAPCNDAEEEEDDSSQAD